MIQLLNNFILPVSIVKCRLVDEDYNCYLLQKYSDRIAGTGNCTILITGTGISYGMHFFHVGLYTGSYN